MRNYPYGLCISVFFIILVKLGLNKIGNLYCTIVRVYFDRDRIKLNLTKKNLKKKYSSRRHAWFLVSDVFIKGSNI